jgi:hypothetical protein
VRNKKTGAEYHLSNDEFSRLLSNPNYKMGFDILTGVAELPEEVKKMREGQGPTTAIIGPTVSEGDEGRVIIEKEKTKPPAKKRVAGSKDSKVE